MFWDLQHSCIVREIRFLPSHPLSVLLLRLSFHSTAPSRLPVLFLFRFWYSRTLPGRLRLLLSRSLIHPLFRLSDGNTFSTRHPAVSGRSLLLFHTVLSLRQSGSLPPLFWNERLPIRCRFLFAHRLISFRHRQARLRLLRFPFRLCSAYGAHQRNCINRHRSEDLLILPLHPQTLS